MACYSPLIILEVGTTMVSLLCLHTEERERIVIMTENMSSSCWNQAHRASMETPATSQG